MKFILCIMIVVIFFLGGILLDANGVIQNPAWWIFYGNCLGLINGIVVTS